MNGTAALPSDRTSLRAILLDFDGTIAETEQGQRTSFNRAFAECGLDWIWDEALYAALLEVAGGRERIRHYVEHYASPDRERAVDEGLIAAVHRVKSRNFEAIAPGIPFRPGVQRLVYEAHFAGVRVAVATTASKRGVEALLSQDSVMPAMIDLIAGGETVVRKKPAPDVYLWALDRLGLRPQECIAIEDSRLGLQSALAAGLTTVVTISAYTVGQDFDGAAAVLTGLGDYDVAASRIRGPAPRSGLVDLAYLRSLLRAAGRRQNPIRLTPISGVPGSPSY